MYSLPHPVFVKARGICFFRAFDDLVDVDASSDVCEGFMLVFAWRYIGFRGREGGKCEKGKQELEDSNDIAHEELDSCLVLKCIFGQLHAIPLLFATSLRLS